MSEEKIIVRPVSLNDEEDWKRLWKHYQEHYEVHLSEEVAERNFKNFLEPGVEMWAAIAINTETGVPIGMVNYLHHLTTWDIRGKMLLHDLFVEEGSRIKGVGRKLMEYVFHEADKMGIEIVYWTTDHYNHRAQLLYTKIGHKNSKVIYER
ncbi:hypothetical protein NCAS_0A09820 [Naumovozyma castellii]|uniref:N-acetyltransferase domain-containing protein n=1 Tax=Naumovozyma castellii TaxID=27288 RepID=G0V7U2_NAUCA|nr:hypothetical protein NCAS_0A09820 [Naumovozyma castellii CBS 4309]CCC67540.1 hypothetical protein NCAS_0A09820 [Naumovozyma castellii CBS 4309]